jgi:hypothetical protein
MPYVTRDPEGQIAALYASRSEEAHEELAADDPDLRAFLGESGQSAGIREALDASDLEMIRVLEDLIMVLIGNGVIKLTDLPHAARMKLARRGELRVQLGGIGDMADEPEEILLP